MAMSTSASPLLQQLKDISARVLAEQQAPGEGLLALVKARLKVAQALSSLDKIDTTQTDGSVTVDKIKSTALEGVSP